MSNAVERVLKAMAHPLRKKIALALADGRDASPKELADRFDESLPLVSYHVGVLRRLGLIQLTRKTPRRGAVEHHYRATVRLQTLELDGHAPDDMIDEFTRLLDNADERVVLSVIVGSTPKDET